VYNEEKYVCRVIPSVLRHAGSVLVIDDGSTDRTAWLLDKFPIDVIRHHKNRGYGRALLDAFYWADKEGFDWLITMDCDEQHEPAAIPTFLAAAAENTHDVISGSRYLAPASADGNPDSSPPPDRRAINAEMTREINRRLGLRLTDSFCGFKAYRVSALRRLTLTEPGYAFPMQFWVQAVAQGLRIREIPVRLIYNDASRTFGGPLDDPEIRKGHYLRVLHCELKRCAKLLPPSALEDVAVECGQT
jgi:dolichol-phosphate mannosyltransferase